jgi:hypothetical protein
MYDDEREFVHLRTVLQQQQNRAVYRRQVGDSAARVLTPRKTGSSQAALEDLRAITELIAYAIVSYG